MLKKFKVKSWNILKQIAQKICSLIQWTKKLHIMHFFVFILLPYTIFTLIGIPFYIIALIGKAEEADFCLIGLVYTLIVSFVGFIPAIIYQIIVIIVKHIQNKDKFVTSNFLLNNRFYNIFYLISWLFLIIAWIVVP